MLYDYIIYAGGSYSYTRNEGAFAYVMLDGRGNHVKQFAKKITNETSNRAELKAIIAALYHLPEGAKHIRVISSSKYALGALFKDWSRNANTDLFEVYDKVVSEHSYEIDSMWVKSRSVDYFELVKGLCNSVLGYDANAEFEKYKKNKH